MEINDLFKILEKLAPGLLTEDFINFSRSTTAKPIVKLGVCVDPTAKNIINATDSGIEVLISYHPWQGEAESVVRRNEIGIWPLHAAWDNSGEGVNYTFARTIELTNLNLKGDILYGTSGTTFREFIERCQHASDQNIISYYGDLKEIANKIGIWAGPGFLPNYKKFWEACSAEGCDTILSSELTLSALRYSGAHQLKLIDLGHSAMAKPGMFRLAQLLREILAKQDCAVDFFNDIYACSYYTNCSFAEQYTELDDIFFAGDPL